ncbi:hypothetical protein J4401_02590 [Candidatus Woesearchaeota archaeon]|nr:hypothetical protein [Candidatus Woesearchaeota archaeon]
MDNRLLKICEKMAEEEREKKSKKKKALELPKEKRLQYYSGWGRGNSSKKEDKQERLV